MTHMGSLRPEDIFDLPDAPDFISDPPIYSMAEMLVLCEPILDYLNKYRFDEAYYPPVTREFRLDLDDKLDEKKTSL